MILNALLLAAVPALAPRPAAELVAFRVGRAETVANGTIENAVVLVDGSKIVIVGEDLPVERGIRIVDRPDWVVIPGLVNAYSRAGLDSTGSSKSTPAQRALDELEPDPEVFERVLKHGVTTLGLYPAGSGIPGLAAAVKPAGSSAQETLLADEVYLKIILRANKASKAMLRDGFAAADKYVEKEQKAREKWEKDQEKKKKPAPKKKEGATEEKEEKKEEPKKGTAAQDPAEDPAQDADEAAQDAEDAAQDAESASEGAAQDEEKEEKKDEKPEEKKEAEGDAYVPPEPDPEARVFLALRAKKLRALVSVSDAADYLHFLDALGKEDIDWSLRIPLEVESDIFYVLDKEQYDLEVDGIGDLAKRVLVEPRITRHPGTLRQRNLPAELARAGAKIVFVPMRDPRNENLELYDRWLRDVGEVVAKGLDRQAALAALTLEPARMLGLEARLGSLEKDKDANLVFLNGDPFEPSTKVEAVMLEGRVVYGEVYP